MSRCLRSRVKGLGGLSWAMERRCRAVRGEWAGRWHNKGHRPPPVAHTGHKESLISSTFLKGRCVPGQAVYKTAALR